MTVDPFRSDNTGASRQAKARAVLDDARRQMAKARPGTPPPAGDVLIRRLAGALGMSQVDVLTIMRATKISYSHRGLTVGKTENFLREARRYPANRAKLTAAPPPETPRRDSAPAAGSKGQVRALRRDRIREAFKAHRAKLDDPTTEDPRREKLAGDVKEITGMSKTRVFQAMFEAGVVAPQRRTVTAESCEQFIALLYGSTPAPPERWPAPMPHLDAHRVETPMRAVARQPREAAARAASAERASVVDKSARTPRAPQFPACQRLVDGVAADSAAAATADIYLTLLELTAYRSTTQAQAIAEIAADRFGIHADATTGARLTTRAQDSWQAGEGGVQLDHLSRLERRLRGVFYDGHLDRVTAWDFSSGAPLLYTCSGAELRTAAAGALEKGDLVPPVMRRQVVSDTYEPTGPENPALVLAVAAEQLGRQASRALHPTAPRITTIEETMEPSVQTRGSTAARTVSAATWVQPVSGDWGGLVLEQMESSYTRHRAGPRTRAATTVREHLRRAPGTSKSEPPTISVRSHPRRGTGPATSAPKVTKVSGRRELWR